MQMQQNTESRTSSILMTIMLSLGILLAFTIIKCRIQNKNLALIPMTSGASDVMELAAYQENSAPIVLENTNSVPPNADAESFYDSFCDGKVSLAASNSDSLH